MHTISGTPEYRRWIQIAVENDAADYDMLNTGLKYLFKSHALQVATGLEGA